MENIKKIKFNSELMFRILILFFWTKETIVSFIISAFYKVPYLKIIAPYINIFLLIFLTLLSLPYILKKIKIIDILGYLCFVAFLVISPLLFKETQDVFKSNLKVILGSAVPLYFLGVSYSHTIHKKDLFYGSVIGIIIVFIYQIYCLLNGRVLENDNMYAAYYTLPSVLYLFYYSFERNGVLNWIFSIIGLFLLFAFGTRGAILSLFIFVILNILPKIKTIKTMTGKIASSILIIVLIIIFSSQKIMMSLISGLSSFFSEIGFSTRIFDMFINGELTLSEGRNKITEQIVVGIKNNPVFGYGILGDRIITGGSYAHNIILELWCQFGIIFGTVFLLSVLFIVFYAMSKTKIKEDLKFIILLVCLVFVKLFLSSSYLIEPYFYFLIGVCIHSIRIGRKT